MSVAESFERARVMLVVRARDSRRNPQRRAYYLDQLRRVRAVLRGL